MRSLRTRALWALAPALLVATACSTGGASTEFGAGDDYSVSSAIAQVPLPEDNSGMLVTADLVAATEAAGTQRPTDFDPDAIYRWVTPMTITNDPSKAGPIFVPMAEVFNTQHLAQMSEFDKELGWSLLDVDAFVELSSPPRSFSVVSGPELALNSELPEVADDVVTAGEGEDFSINLESITPARPTGVPLRMTLQDGKLAASPSTDLVTQWRTGPKKTLADHEAFAELADVLDDAEVSSAVLDGSDSFTVDNAFGGRANPQAIEALAESLPADPFLAVGVGWAAAPDGTSQMTVGYFFADDQAAQSAAPVFQELFANANSLRSGQPLKDSFTLADAKTDGQVVVLTLEPTGSASAMVLWSWFIARDLPFLHR